MIYIVSTVVAKTIIYMVPTDLRALWVYTHGLIWDRRYSIANTLK